MKNIQNLETVVSLLIEAQSGARPKKIIAYELGVTPRHLSRVLRAFSLFGEKGLLHKAKGKPSHRRVSKDKENVLLNLAVNNPGMSLRKLHKQVKLRGDLKMSYSTMRRILLRNQIQKLDD